MNYPYSYQSDDRFVPFMFPFLGPVLLGGLGGFALGAASRPRPYPMPIPYQMPPPRPYSYYSSYNTY